MKCDILNLPWDFSSIAFRHKNEGLEFYFDETFVPITEQIVPGIYDKYLISNYGKILDMSTDKFLNLNKHYTNNTHKTEQYYLNIGLHTINGRFLCGVHRLVMACFYPNLGNVDKFGLKNNLEINHKNGIGHYNYISYNNPNIGNLEWMTHKENINHAYENGFSPRGEKIKTSKISESTAKEVIELLLTNKYTNEQIVNIVGKGVTDSIVRDIKKKTSWCYLTKNIEFEHRKGHLFSDDLVVKICEYFVNNPIPNDLKTTDYFTNIIKYFNIEDDYHSRKAISSLYHKRNYRYITSNYNY